MTASTVSIVLVIAVGLTAPPVFAQATRTGDIEQAKAEKAAAVRPPVREPGDRLFTRIEGFFQPALPAAHLTFGDFRPGAGFGLGAALGIAVGERGLWTSAGAVSLNRFKVLETAIDVPPFSTDRVRVVATARWDDAPELHFFGLGMDAPSTSDATYGLRSTDVGGDVRVRGPRHLSYGVSLKYARVDPIDGTGDAPTAGPTVASDWVHSAAYVEVDTRQSPGYTTSGTLYHLAVHDYAGQRGAPSFRRTEIDVRQFVPILHGNWIVALQARAELTAVPDGQAVPFFMLPYLGGRDSLPGFADYRFTDRDALLLRSELRWTPSPVVDMAAFVDAGSVAARVGALELGDMRHSWGLGARIHGSTVTALRLQVAHSVEGWRYNIAQGVTF
jgi:hypothetical protein